MNDRINMFCGDLFFSSNFYEAPGDTYLEEGNTWGARMWGTVNGAGANRLVVSNRNVCKFVQSARQMGIDVDTDSIRKSN